jgi:hypothetical protein
MITAETRGLFKTHREAEKRQTKDARAAKTEAGKRAASPTDVLVDPMVTLGLSEHQCRLVTELHLGKKNMTKLHPSITTFSNLEELWVNDNRLKRVVGLLPAPGTVALSDGARGCNRLKRLYASNNVISSLEGDLTRLRYLEVLLLANNRLSNMELVSQQLASLRFLKQLDLFGNPLAEEQNYRLYIVHQHPQLELLDRRSVSDEERREAAALFAAGGLATLGGVSRGGGTSNASSNASDSAGSPVRGRGTMSSPSASPVAFLTSVPKYDPLPPVGPVSGAARLVEAKVKQLRMQALAAAEVERTKEESAADARAEKRRLFHSIWAAHGKQGSAPKPDVASSPEAAKSRLYNLDDESTAVARLIDLARQRELATTDKRREEIDALIAKRKHELIPERFSDEFGSTLKEAKVAAKDATERDYSEAVVRMVFTPQEVDACARAFGSNPLTAVDAPSLLKLIQGGDSLNSGAFTTMFASRLASSGEATSGVAMRAALRILADYEPFLEARHTRFYKLSEAAVTKNSAGAATAALRSVNFIVDHQKRLVRERSASSSAGDEGTGSAMAALLSRHRVSASAGHDSDSD